MATYNFPIEGADQLRKKLLALEPRIAKKVVRQAVRPAAKLIQDAAKANVAVDTGKLKRSLKVRSLKRSRNRIGVQVSTNSTDNLFKGNTFYGGFLEYGHRLGKRTNAQKRKGYKGPDSRKMVPAKPFMKPAFEAKKNEAGQMIVDLLRAGVEREASK